MPAMSDDQGELPIDPEPADQPASIDDAEEVEHFVFSPTKNIQRRIDQYLVDRLPYLSRNAVQRLIGEGLVKANGRIIKASYRPRDGDRIEMVAPPKPVNEIIPEDIPLDIIYEDEHFLALNKQANLIVHPARGVWHGTLVNGLVHYGAKWSTVNGEWRPGILHRLDRNTTGIMLVAKSDEAHWRIARQFENRTIQKTYMAIIEGIPQLLGDVIDMPIGKDRYVREKQAVRKEAAGGRPAVTLYQVMEALKTPLGDFALVKLTPKTGRTHQLRVHMSHRGHPMIGDTMYGGKPFEHNNFRFDRQALHAYEITFIHPATLKPITLQAPLPPDIQRLLEVLRNP